MSDVRPMTAAEMVKWLDDWKEVTVSVDDVVLESLRGLVEDVERASAYPTESFENVMSDDGCPDCTGWYGPQCNYHQAKALLKALDDRKK